MNRGKHWIEAPPSGCRTCSPQSCECGPFCRSCEAPLGVYPGRGVERCSACMFDSPTMFGTVPASNSFALDLDRQARFDVCARWWRGRPERSSVRMLVVRLAGLIDRGLVVEGRRPFETFADAAAEHFDRTLDARLELASFVDAHGADLELLVASYCRGQGRRASA